MEQRYDRVAIALHWVMALAIITMIVMGLVMEDVRPIGLRIQVYQFHKSLGLTVLFLSLVRLGWRLAHPAPSYPAHMKPWEKLAAHATHWGLYALMVAMPLSGWLLISTGSNKFPTLYFGLFNVPKLDFFGEASKAVHHYAAQAHELLPNIAIAMLVLHVLAALKHHFLDRDNVLTRILPRFMLAALTRRSHA